ncbi:MAG: sigma-70 family RNA polymerase sigma factor, partial [Candidatus Omnitrophica bacterium]|nr:sigma-70 family RNA polymerase sigma factor [Candidatus Omnitrophota bacterium]
IFAKKKHLKNISENNPISEYETTDKKETIRSAVSKLPLHYKEIITLYYFEEMSVDEIAHHLNINQGTVKSRLFNAREHLKNLVEPR